MLSSEDRMLIAASMDDSLPPEADARLRELLHQSEEARALDHALRHERELLSQLDRASAARDILPNVMRIIESQTAIPRNQQLPHSSRNRRFWLPASLAASVILLAGSSVWLGVQAQQHRELVREKVESLPIIEDTERTDHAQTNRENPSSVSQPNPPREPIGSDQLLSTSDSSFTLSLTFLDLNQGETKQRLLHGLKRMSDATIEITSSDSALAAEYLVATGRSVGVNVLIDSNEQDRLRRRMPMSWLVYCENLTPDDCVHWLIRLSMAKTRERNGLSVFNNLRLFDTDPKLKNELRTHLNRDPKLASSNPMPDPSELGTIALLTGYPPRLASDDNHQSREVKIFSNHRHERKPGTIALTIVMHKP